MHELQHLISFSQHTVIHGGNPEYGWLDEGLSIVAEELGSVYYEQKCPGTACRTNPSQLFPDSSQGFIQGFLYDSYQYALLPDTASLTLHGDSDDGFAWRGGDWLLMRWLGDQMGAGFYRKLEQSSLTGVANIQAASGQSFPALFANFGLSLFTDSLPGFPRTTAPAADRFASRNIAPDCGLGSTLPPAVRAFLWRTRYRSSPSRRIRRQRSWIPERCLTSASTRRRISRRSRCSSRGPGGMPFRRRCGHNSSYFACRKRFDAAPRGI